MKLGNWVVGGRPIPRSCVGLFSIRREGERGFKVMLGAFVVWAFVPRCHGCNDDGVLPNGEGCPECCEHSEHDHFICLDCGREGEPSDYYDEDYGLER